MLGWEIFVYRQDLIDANIRGPKEQALLAKWLVGPGGLDWIDALVREGRATHTHRNGYPMTYLAKAADVLPLIVSGVPKPNGPLVIGDDYVMPAGWIGEPTIHHSKIADCDPERLLQIDAWDQS